MIYPNWIYYPEDDLELFIDTVQQTGYVTGCKVTDYYPAVGGIDSVVINKLPTATFECTWDTNHIKDLHRYLAYLRGKEVIFGFGPKDLASYVKITEASIKWAVGTVQKATLSVQFLGDVRGQFREAEDSRNTSGGANYSDTLASGGIAKKISAVGSSVNFEITQSDVLIPAGNYTMFARVKDSAQVTDDLLLDVVDRDGTLMETLYTTATSSFKLYTLDFEITSSEQEHRILFEVMKNKTSTNNIYVDFLGFFLQI